MRGQFIAGKYESLESWKEIQFQNIYRIPVSINRQHWSARVHTFIYGKLGQSAKTCGAYRSYTTISPRRSER